MKQSLPIHYIRKNFDTLTITKVLASLAWTDLENELDESQQAVLAALKQSYPELVTASLAEIQHYLQGFNEHRIIALVKQVKMTLHNMEFVRLDHEDGDRLYACYFNQPHHVDFEALLSDHMTGESWKIQLKAIDQRTGKDWGLSQPEDHLIALQEVATQFTLESSGLRPKELVQSVEDAIDLIVTAKDPNDEHFWEYFPAISIASVSIAIFELYRRYQKQQISWSEFKWMAAKISGLKVSKIAFIGLLLGLPVVGHLTGAYLGGKTTLKCQSDVV